VKDGKAGSPGPGDTLGAVLRVAVHVTTYARQIRIVRIGAGCSGNSTGASTIIEIMINHILHLSLYRRDERSVSINTVKL